MIYNRKNQSLIFKCCYWWNMIFCGLLVIEPYSCGHVVEGNFQISNFASKFEFAYGIALQIKISTCLSIIFFSKKIDVLWSFFIIFQIFVPHINMGRFFWTNMGMYLKSILLSTERISWEYLNVALFGIWGDYPT